MIAKKVKNPCYEKIGFESTESVSSKARYIPVSTLPLTSFMISVSSSQTDMAIVNTSELGSED